MMETTVIFDIESVPIDTEKYETLTALEQKKTINPIDQKIVGIGTITPMGLWTEVGHDEYELLFEFWQHLPQIFKLCGFNIKQFDLPMLVARSFANNIPVKHFNVHETIDLREYLNCHRWGYTRGKLKEYGDMVGIPDVGDDGSMIYDLYKEGKYSEITTYLEKDLQITKAVYERCNQLGIMSLRR